MVAIYPQLDPKTLWHSDENNQRLRHLCTPRWKRLALDVMYGETPIK